MTLNELRVEWVMSIERWGARKGIKQWFEYYLGNSGFGKGHE